MHTPLARVASSKIIAIGLLSGTRMVATSNASDIYARTKLVTTSFPEIRKCGSDGAAEALINNVKLYKKCTGHTNQVTMERRITLNVDRVLSFSMFMRASGWLTMPRTLGVNGSFRSGASTEFCAEDGIGVEADSISSVDA